MKGLRLALLMLLVAAMAPAHGHRDPGDSGPIIIGWAAWASNEITAKIVARVLREHMGREVELLNLDVAPMYHGLAAGDIDVVLAGWLPTAHRRYLDGLGRSIVNLGVLYDRARMGWVVPDYVPEDALRSIDDLDDPAVRERLRNRIVGIDPGAGMTALSRRALEEYGLSGYELRISSGAGMTAALGRAIRRGEWIVVNGWSPHWMWQEWDLRYLEDPRGVFGGLERVHVLVRPGFYEDRVDVAAALGRMRIPFEDVSTALRRSRETSFEQAAREYVASNPGRIAYWVSGRMPR